MPSLYAQYIAEREGKEILETEHGFATYLIRGLECYIEDLYIKPEHRESGLASKMADEIAIQAKERGCKYLLGSTVVEAQGSTTALKVLLAYGFKLAKAEANMIWLTKELA